MLKTTSFASLWICLFIISACGSSGPDNRGSNGPDTGVSGGPDTGVTPTCVAGVVDPACGPRPAAPVVAAGDYGFWYRPTNRRGATGSPVMHFRTGAYGIAFDEATGQLTRFGALRGERSESAAQHDPNSDIDNLPQAEIHFEAGDAGAGIVATEFLGVGGEATDRSRLIDGGRTMNRIEIPELSYAADATLDGRVEVASMPRHVVFTHQLRGTSGAATSARVRLAGAAIGALTTATWLADGRALRLTNATGDGWLFVVYDLPGTTTLLTYSADRGVVAERTVSAAPTDGLSVSLLAVPTTAIGPNELALYLNPEEAVEVSYTLLNPDGNEVRGPIEVPWDQTLGAYNVALGRLQEAGIPGGGSWDDEATHNLYGRHQLEVDTGGRGPVAVPLAFFGLGGTALYIVAGVPVLRDGSGEPLGVPVQISKNWHGATGWWDEWYHFYAQPTFAGATEEMELTIVSSRWGETYAASHAQLSLINFAANGGHWDESALGSFGESVTYDPDVSLGRAMIDDVRPFLVNSGGRWGWTGNVGGADFLRYTASGPPAAGHRLSNVRSRYAAVGPVLTDVSYGGVSSDGRIRAEMRTQLGGTDDLVRVYYELSYTFLEDVTYDRLAFFQVAADNYGDNGYSRFAYGNEASVQVDGWVTNHGSRGYASEADRGIALPGESPWVMLYANLRTGQPLPEEYANLGFIVRAFEANIGGTVVTTPHINITQTNNGWSQLAFELGLPFETGAVWCGAPCRGQRNFIPAGSTVRATVEYVVAPADKERYYGTSPYLTALPPEVFNSARMMQELAGGNRLTVEAAVGTVRRTQPVEIEAARGAVAADLELTGGRGLVPMTFRGLIRHDGWQLQQADGDVWTRVDRSVHGNDYWQTEYDPDTETYGLTFVVPNVGTQRYRLVWVPAS